MNIEQNSVKYDATKKQITVTTYYDKNLYFANCIKKLLWCRVKPLPNKLQGIFSVQFLRIFCLVGAIREAKFGSLHPAPCRSVRLQSLHNSRFVKLFSFVSCPLVPSFSLQKLQKSCRKLQCACYGISLAQEWQKTAVFLRMLFYHELYIKNGLIV